MVIITAALAECANIQVPEGKSVEDIFSTLKTFRTNILDLISNGFTAPEKVKPPSPPSHEKYRPLVIPSPPPRLPQEYPQALYYVTSPSNLGHNSHPIFTTKVFLYRKLWKRTHLIIISCASIHYQFNS